VHSHVLLWILVPLALCVYLLVSTNLKMIQDGRLKGYSIATSLCSGFFYVMLALVSFYVPMSWMGGGKLVVMFACLWLGFIFGGLTKKASPTSFRHKSRHRKQTTRLGK